MEKMLRVFLPPYEKQLPIGVHALPILVPYDISSSYWGSRGRSFRGASCWGTSVSKCSHWRASSSYSRLVPRSVRRIGVLLALLRVCEVLVEGVERVGCTGLALAPATVAGVDDEQRAGQSIPDLAACIRLP